MALIVDFVNWSLFLAGLFQCLMVFLAFYSEFGFLTFVAQLEGMLSVFACLLAWSVVTLAFGQQKSRIAILITLSMAIIPMVYSKGASKSTEPIVNGIVSISFVLTGIKIAVCLVGWYSCEVTGSVAVALWTSYSLLAALVMINAAPLVSGRQQAQQAPANKSARQCPDCKQYIVTDPRKTKCDPCYRKNGNNNNNNRNNGGNQNNNKPNILIPGVQFGAPVYIPPTVPAVPHQPNRPNSNNNHRKQNKGNNKFKPFNDQKVAHDPNLDINELLG